MVGLDALAIAPLAIDLLPRPAPGQRTGWRCWTRTVVFLNAAARDKTGAVDGQPVQVQFGLAWQALRVAGSVAAGGPPLAVMDVAGAQARFGFAGRLSRIDLRLAPGADRAALVARLALPAGVEASAADDAEQRVSNLSRAYRVNLTVLALVALVRRRLPGVLGRFAVGGAAHAGTRAAGRAGHDGGAAPPAWCWPSARCWARPAACWG